MGLRRKLLTVLSATVLLLLLGGYHLQERLLSLYVTNESPVLSDRYGKEVAVEKNQKGNYARHIQELPPRFRELLLQKEDKYFFYHLGVNPWSTVQAALYQVGVGERKASSTITQQLVKVLLGNESNRTLHNKITEILYTVALELFQSKETILTMYTNSVYFGNQTQGLFAASRAYFGVDPELLSDSQIVQLLATINRPTSNNPSQPTNKPSSLLLASLLHVPATEDMFQGHQETNTKAKTYFAKDHASFELLPFLPSLPASCQFTIDLELTRKVRKIVEQTIAQLKAKDARNAAVVVIKLPENELLAMVGSPDPDSFQDGYKINMALEPRPIGSTIKPFIYMKAFEKELRPYTLVDDREYKYITALGFPLYPQNFDSKYRGEVTLHYALSNSLNVPAVKVLEYVGLENFYQFLERDLEFTPIQDFENYQLGIALGTLEMSLFDLAHYFTIFPNKGMLSPTTVFRDNSCAKQEQNATEKRVGEEPYVQLLNKILNDRVTGIEQFGLVSELNLFQDNYALKTGTSRDFQDSWVIGYTPDFLVGVWLGNADATSTDKLSGQIGAGKIWAQTMELLLHSPYNDKTPFDFSHVKGFQKTAYIEYGLLGDNYEYHRDILKAQDTSLIVEPHGGDVFLLQTNSHIMLQAKKVVRWFVNGEPQGSGSSLSFVPSTPGEHTIQAIAEDQQEETITIDIVE